MIKLVRRIVRKMLNKAGFEVVLLGYETSHSLVLKKLIDDFQVKTVFDVGANEGQFGNMLRQLGYGNKIISFEPLSKAWNNLKENSKNDAAWIVAKRAALGNQEGTIEINVSENSQSSSILAMEKSHKSAAPQSEYVSVEQTEITTLDKFIELNNEVLSESMMLKIDTQGYEMNVLMGAERVLEKIKIVELELSFIELYTGQQLYKEMVEHMEKRQFVLWSVFPVFCDKDTGRMLQADAIFVKQV